MANTTNFGWETPDDTDLVKDGAAAIRTLGSAIDTSLVDLKGGTTGQVLAKASNTDMDFNWVAQDDSNAIQNALLTTTGDTIYASAASTPARLGIGTNGQVLTVSGGVPIWQTPAGGGKVLQVVYGSTSTQASSSTSTYVDTNLTATITPSAASSKVLVLVAQNGLRKQTGNVAVSVRLLRGATTLITLDSDAANNNNSGVVNAVGGVSAMYLDTPATTSATTYKTQFAAMGNTASVSVNSNGYNGSTSTIVLLEIGA